MNKSNTSHYKLVSSFFDLTNTKFKDKTNAIGWLRNLEGDFAEIVSKLQIKENITEVYREDLLALNLTEKGNIARNIILEDLQLLTDLGALPTLNLLKSYERDDEFDYISTDVYSFHVDRSPIETDTFLCTYFGASSDIISNDYVTQKILIPEIREKLKQLHNDDSNFDDFLRENYFDLHYEPNPNAHYTNLGIGHLWRLAVDHPKQEVLPCVHRAPKENKGEYRLLLIC